jgi:hypothetical protein
VYGADGSFLARTTGVNAARDRAVVERVDALAGIDGDAGRGGRVEPSIGQWSPTTA